jgi:hypothetical protein
MHFEPLAFETSCSPARPAARTRRAAQPLLRLWRRRPPGAAGGLARTRAHGAGGCVNCSSRFRPTIRSCHALCFHCRPARSLKAYKDSSIAMMRAAQAPVTPSGPSSSRRSTGRLARCLRRSGASGTAADDKEWFVEITRHVVPLRDFAAVVMRKDPPFDMEYVTTTWLLERAEAEGARVFNRPRPCATIRKSSRSSNFPSSRCRRWSRAKPGRSIPSSTSRDTILKPLDGMGGSQVFRVRHDDPNRNVIIETLTARRHAHDHGAALHPGNRRRRQAHPDHRRRSRSRIAWRASRRPARRAAIWPPAAPASRAELTARDREIAEARWRRCLPSAACCSSAST